MYRDILDDIEWHQLDAQSSKVLVMCWLIASENDGNLPDLKTLAFRLRMSEKNTSESIIKLSHWLEQDDINVISQRYQDVIPETEREKEKETEKRQKATVVATPDGVSEIVWKEFVNHRKSKKAQITQTVINDIAKQANIAGWTLEDALKETIVRNWQSFKAEWVAPKAILADRIHLTVPSKQERDPALVKLDNDAKITAPPPTHILERIKQLRKEA